jgi:hypothetical protein
LGIQHLMGQRKHLSSPRHEIANGIGINGGIPKAKHAKSKNNNDEDSILNIVYKVPAPIRRQGSATIGAKRF